MSAVLAPTFASASPDTASDHAEDPRARDAREGVAAKTQALEARLLYGDQIDRVPAPDPLIAGVLWRDSVVELWGKPGCGKTFLALDWALCVASGKSWQGHRVTQGRVLYIIGEGVGGVGKRRRAWVTAWHSDARRVTWLREPVPLLSTEWVAALGEIVKTGFELVVVDTVSRALAGQNENASEVMSALVAHVDWLRATAGGACVLLVHHATKDGSTNRGHSALEGACDVRWKLAKDSTALTLSCDKSKDEAQPADIGLRLKVIELGENAAGEKVTSAVLESHGHADWQLDLPASEATLLRVMRDSFETTGASSGELRDVAGLAKATHYRALNALLRRGELINVGTQKRPHYVLNGWADHA